MSEESTQIFRGSDAPEITFAETRPAVRPKPAVAPPPDQRALNDAKDGPTDNQTLPDGAEVAEVSQRRIDDAASEHEAELRQLHDADAPLPVDAGLAPAADAANIAAGVAGAAHGPAEVREWQDTSAAAPQGAAPEDSNVMLPAPGAVGDSSAALPATAAGSDGNAMLPTTAIDDSRVMLPPTDADGSGPAGPAASRQLHDASAPLPATGTQAVQDGAAAAAGSASAGGPEDTRRVRDTVAPKPGANFQPDAETLRPAAAHEQGNTAADAGPMPGQQPAVPAPAVSEAPAMPASAVAGAAASAVSDPDLTFRDAQNATPWALSIHLQERIASLGVSTARVGHQLDALEESIKRLGKRIKK